jgi:ABC-type multidrug transport system fused ATPase/permease subunit
MRNRTAIVVAHRLSTIEHADRIIVMHHGKIREMGTHRELITRDGLYARLHELQRRGVHDAGALKGGVTAQPDAVK